MKDESGGEKVDIWRFRIGGLEIGGGGSFWFEKGEITLVCRRNRGCLGFGFFRFFYLVRGLRFFYFGCCC